jgi:ribonuclease P protein component
MLARTSRLVKTKDIEHAFKRGRSFFSRSLGLKVVINELGVNRFALVVSTKISKKAVVRNKIKRSLRDILRIENKHLKVGYDLVVITLPAIVDLKQPDIRNEIKGVLQRAKLYQ